MILIFCLQPLLSLFQCMSCYGDAELDESSSLGKYCHNKTLVFKVSVIIFCDTLLIILFFFPLRFSLHHDGTTFSQLASSSISSSLFSLFCISSDGDRLKLGRLILHLFLQY